MARPVGINAGQAVACGLQALPLAAVLIAAIWYKGTTDPLLPVFILPVYGLAACALWMPAARLSDSLARFGFLSLILFGAYLTASVLWSSAPYVSGIFAMVFGVLPMVAVACLMRPTLRLAWTVALGCVAVGLALWACYAFYLSPVEAGTRISGPMLNPNNLAALFSMILPASAVIASRARGAKGLIALGLYALLFAALMTTRSRAGLGITILCLLPVAVFLWADLRQRAGVALLLLLIPMALWVATNHSGGDRLTQAYAALAQPATQSTYTDRVALWSSGLEMLKDHPVGGIGLGAFFYAYPAYRQTIDVSDGYFVHMDPLQFMIETGVGAGLLYAIALAALLVHFIRAQRQGDGARRRIAVAAFLGLLTLALHSQISFNLYMPGLLIPAGILIGWLLYADNPAPSLSRNPRIALAVCLTLLTGAWGVLSIRVAIANRDMAQAYALMRQGDLNAATLIAGKVAAMAPANNFSADELQARLSLGKLQHMAQDAPRDAFVAEWSTGLKAIEQAQRKNPLFATLQSLEAQFYYLGDGITVANGAARAEEMLKAAIQTDPLNLDARKGLALIYEQQGRFRDALDVLEAGLQWPRPRGRAEVDFMLAIARQRLALGDRAGFNEMVGFAERQAQRAGLLTAEP